MPSKVVIRVFFPDGLFKTALIDSETKATGLISIIGKKLSLEYSTQIDLEKCELYECEIENPDNEEDLKPLWTKNPFGNTKHQLDSEDVPYDFVQKWISTNVALRCRFVMVYKLPDDFVARKKSDGSMKSPNAKPVDGPAASVSPSLVSQASTDGSTPRVDSTPIDSSKIVETKMKVSLAERYFEFINTHRVPGKPPVRSYDDVRNGVPILDVLEFVSKIKVSVNIKINKNRFLYNYFLFACLI